MAGNKAVHPGLSGQISLTDIFDVLLLTQENPVFSAVFHIRLSLWS